MNNGMPPKKIRKVICEPLRYYIITKAMNFLRIYLIDTNGCSRS